MRKFFDETEESMISLKVEAPAAPQQKYGPEKAWVVFSGKSDWPWLKFLRPGFRHCFVIVHDGARWLSLDPLSPRTRRGHASNEQPPAHSRCHPRIPTCPTRPGEQPGLSLPSSRRTPRPA